MDVIKLAQQLRRVSDLISRKLDQALAIGEPPVKARYVPLLTLLHREGPLNVSRIASMLEITVPAVTQIVRDLRSNDWLQVGSVSGDERKKMLSLSPLGQLHTEKVIKRWQLLQDQLERLFSASRYDLAAAVVEFERQLKPVDLSNPDSLYDAQEQVQIISWDPRYKRNFYDLNADWIERYFELEDADKSMLLEPELNILRNDGYIFFARLGGAIVGTCALKKYAGKQYELTKMAVSPFVQGRGIGRLLGEAAIVKAKSLFAKQLFLESNSRLKSATRLYKNLGFKEAKRINGESSYQRVDIYMEMSLETSSAEY